MGFPPTQNIIGPLPLLRCGFGFTQKPQDRETRVFVQLLKSMRVVSMPELFSQAVNVRRQWHERGILHCAEGLLAEHLYVWLGRVAILVCSEAERSCERVGVPLC